MHDYDQDQNTLLGAVATYKPDDYRPDDSDTNCVKSKPRTKNRRSRGRARGST